jgi:hypothetical protein
MEVEPPARVERRPTDILRALADTVGTDHSAPHYKVSAGGCHTLSPAVS